MESTSIVKHIKGLAVGLYITCKLSWKYLLQERLTRRNKLSLKIQLFLLFMEILYAFLISSAYLLYSNNYKWSHPHYCILQVTYHVYALFFLFSVVDGCFLNMFFKHNSSFFAFDAHSSFDIITFININTTRICY